MKNEHLNIRVQGRVQGVWFRKYTKDKAVELGLFGFVQNELNGDVYIEVEGKPEILDRFIEWLYIGSPMSKVEQVIYREGTLKNFSTFEITR